MHKLRIFAASPSDTATERAKVDTVAASLKPIAESLGIVLDAADWRSVVPDMGRPEQIILDQLKPTQWDIFVGILWHRFGTPTAARDARTQQEYLSGTEEEFKTAYALWQQHGKPRLMMYRCTRPVPLDALDPDQFKRVKEFFAQFDAVKGEHPGLYQSFDTTEAFERLLLDNLQHVLLAYGEKLKGAPVAPEIVQALPPRRPDNLPRRAPFFGRDKEMAVVLRALGPGDRTWGVLIDGIGGIGKTSLATEAAHRCKEQALFDAFVFVTAKQNILKPAGIDQLTPPARTLDDFLDETARLLGQPGIPKLNGGGKRHALLDALRETRTLLVYDNLETLTKEEQESIADFLRELPTGCKAIITSRRRGGEGSVWLRLERLEWDAAHQLILAEADKDAHLNAKLQHAGQARWPELYDATGGSPLALSHTLGLMRVRASLTFNAALEMLRGNRDADLQKFVFQEARTGLTINDQAALRALSFFVSSATFEAWMDVADLSRAELEITTDRLSALSLVDVLSGGERYALHPLTRNFVREELLADESTAYKTGMRFANYWMAYASKYGGHSKNYKTFNLIEAEWANLYAAAEWLWQAADVRGSDVSKKDAALTLSNLSNALCDSGGPLFYAGWWDEKIHLSARAYAAMSGLARWGEAGWHAYRVAKLYVLRGFIVEALAWADHCTKAWEQGGGQYEQATSLHLRGMVATQSKNYDYAESLLREALNISRGIGPDEEVAMLNALGLLEGQRGRYDAAEQYFREGMQLFENLKSKEGIVTAYVNLGTLSIFRQQWAEARAWCEKGLQLAREIALQDSIASAQEALARVYEVEGKSNKALSLAQEALAIREKLRNRHLTVVRELVERLKKKVHEQ